MKPITRRQALQLGALGGLGVVIGGIGLSQTGLPWGRAMADGELLIEPEVLRSSGGLLQVDLVAARRELTIAGRQVHALTYGGMVPGRTWRVRPGLHRGAVAERTGHPNQPAYARTTGVSRGER